MKKLHIDLNEILLSISFALDFVEMDVLGASSNHSKRVATIAMKLGKHFGLNSRDLFDLCSYSVLHDNGIAEEDLNRDVKLRPEEKGCIAGLEQYHEHCEYGERNVALFPFQTGNRNIIRYHHEKYDGSGFYGLSGEEIPLLAQLIAIADTVDNLYHFERTEPENRRAIIDFISERRGSWFAPRVAEALLSAAEHASFWLELQNQFIDVSVRNAVPSFSEEITWTEIYDITLVLASIIDAKSRFTSRHSTELEEKICRLAGDHGYGEEEVYQLCIAAHLHDLGKLAVPNEILDKPAKLTAGEFDIVYAHPFYTRRGLEQISLFGELTGWAANHHERLDGSGYPYGLRAEELSYEDTLFMALDVYQALTEERPYRGSLGHQKAMSIMREEAALGKLDAEITEKIALHFG